MFKPGQKVRAIEGINIGSPYRLKKGKVYTVDRYIPNGYPHTTRKNKDAITLKEHPGKTDGWLVERFVAAGRPKESFRHGKDAQVQ